MIATPLTERIPLEADPDGNLRIAQTRVPLATVVAAFAEGQTAEEIVQQYPTLKLADVYSVLGHCLRHPSKVEAHLQDQERNAQTIREQNESQFAPGGIRARLLARRKV